ncbi:hypothetical protein [Xanthomonas campestris]|uniref:hypothetical protein n=1 Tax=Xanthomonas campestris TaxID=339 RepID=UPI00096DF33F|nr:hypothetical protein [Xanthomonas campestris]WVL61779.1 hypothetical protein LLE68_005140 [Xanthomonas campestris pv. barbareae]
MDIGISPAILETINAMCKDAKDEIETMAHYAKAEITGNSNQKDVIGVSLKEIIESKDTASQSHTKPRSGRI